VVKDQLQLFQQFHQQVEVVEQITQQLVLLVDLEVEVKVQQVLEILHPLHLLKDQMVEQDQGLSLIMQLVVEEEQLK
tara:strand:+ start:333 stop:563 length:231 start_codon:yes stop_codon:yes gene_type:complete